MCRYEVPKSYTFGDFCDAPGSFTCCPTPKERTQRPASMASRCASIERFMLLAHTIANFSGISGAEGPTGRSAGSARRRWVTRSPRARRRPRGADGCLPPLRRRRASTHTRAPPPRTRLHTQHTEADAPAVPSYRSLTHPPPPSLAPSETAPRGAHGRAGAPRGATRDESCVERGGRASATLPASLTHSLPTHSLARSPTHSLTHSLTPSLPPSLPHSTHSLPHSLAPGPPHSLSTHSLPPSLPPSPPNSLPPSLPPSLSQSRENA